MTRPKIGAVEERSTAAEGAAPTVDGRKLRGRIPSTDTPRRPDEFLDLAREIRAGWDQDDEPAINPALADQMRAANRDARRLMGGALERVIDVDRIGERELALVFALTAAADRRGLYSTQDPRRPRPEVIDLHNRLRGHCDVCDTRAHRLEQMLAQYGPYIFRARVCVRCRRFAPEQPREVA
jgi:hypothetical protein